MTEFSGSRYVEWWEGISAQLNGADSAQCLARLEAERAQLQSAFSQSLRETDTETALRICAALQPFWRMRGHLDEAWEWSKAALLLAGEADRGSALAAVLNGAGVLARMRGDYAAARDCHERGLEIRREIGEKLGVAASLNGLGNLACAQGDYPEARRRFEESLALKQEEGNRNAVAGALNNLGYVGYLHGDYPAARDYYSESLAIRLESGSLPGIAAALDGFAELAAAEQDWRKAVLLWGAAEALRAQSGSVLPDGEQEARHALLTAARGSVGANQFFVWWAEGTALSPERAAAFALDLMQ